MVAWEIPITMANAMKNMMMADDVINEIVISRYISFYYFNILG